MDKQNSQQNQSGDDQVKKYLTLAKQAQNEALISLIADGLRNEIKNQPLRVSNILLDFCKKELLRGETSDFTRLKVSEGFVPVLTKVEVSQELFDIKTINTTSLEKQADRLERSCLVVPLNKDHFKELNLNQISSSKFFVDLIQQYQPLLASNQDELNEVVDSKQAKENTKLGIKKVVMGKLGNISSIKLSDMIDDKFLEDVDKEEIQSHVPIEKKTPLAQLVAHLENNSQSIFMHHAIKRQKTDADSIPKYAIMTPSLALLLYQAEQLLNLDWKKRQIAACQLRHIIGCGTNQYDYSLVNVENGEFVLKHGYSLSRQQLARTILPRVLICMLKDNFSDFEGLKVMAPVREECLRLLSTILPDLQSEVEQLLTLLPSIFIAVEREQWHSKLNFFLIVKGIVLKAEKAVKQRVLEIFGQLLIVAIPTVEDEPKVAITELLMLLLPTYLGSFNSPKVPTKTMTLLLDNLSINLQKADEVEASAIAVFNLVCKIFEMRSEFKCLKDFKYRLDLKIFSAFNFHKLEPVRISYNQLILQALISGSFNQTEDLSLLHTLTVQSLAMESNLKLIEILIQVLEQVIYNFRASEYQIYLSNDLLTDDKLTNWMVCIQPDFLTFKFVELPTFQSIGSDYFLVVFRPANDLEWDTFQNQKTQNLTRAIAVMMSTGKCTNLIFDSLSKRTQVLYFIDVDQPAQPRTILNQSMVHLMLILEQYTRLLYGKIVADDGTFELVDQAYLQDLASQLIQTDDRDISINECWSLAALIESLKQFISTAKTQGHKFLVELSEFTLSCFEEMINTQMFRSREQDFHGLIEELNQQTAIVGDQLLGQIFIQFYGQYQSVLSYIQEYSLRLKASASGVLLGIAKIHMNVADPQDQQAFLAQFLNLVIKPLLCQINQERVLALKQLACDSICDLLQVLEFLKMATPLKRVLMLCINMISDSGPEEETKLRDEALEYLVVSLFEKNENVYVQFKGVIGNEVLKPKLGHFSNIQPWLKIAKLFLKCQKKSIQKDYYLKATAMFQSLVKQTFSFCCNDLEDILMLPQFFADLFNQSTETQQCTLMDLLNSEMIAKKRVAFNCLDVMLDHQINGNQSQNFIKYLPLFILPVIKSLQLQNQIYQGDKKLMKVLAKLIQILPLNLAGLNLDNSLPIEMQRQVSTGLDFLKVFANNEIVENYEIKIPTVAKLRTYQLQGINWMAKLGSYNLNCILCDDMGLGKTLQSLTVVLNESANQKKHVTNLVVCPTSLTYNWLSEIKKFFPNTKAVVLEGAERIQIFEEADQYDVMIINYEKVKGSLASLQKINFFYVVLDEAHKIKNSKSVVTQSVMKLNASRKLALSGTPLQNRVSELWSLFDFIMPDFLEDESTFNKMYNKYLTGNIKRMQEKLEDTQQFIEALKSLKRRISPFILRRTKEDVLQELPPKVIQDFECIMPQMQFNVHQIVERKHPFQNVIGKQSNSLQNLILHRKTCNHPILVQDLVEGLPLVQSGYQNSAKLIGLIEILQDTEIIEPQTIEDDKNFITEVKQPHRALVFCQMQSFMNIVEQDVLKHFGINYLVLTGSMSSKDRVEVVDKFNSNAQYKILLLTTSVGGLGLTLTGADVVIFVEHDWNPMKDLQAMDRAHRIGQTRIVNVYRLIVKDTIEQKIMSLQRFKENLAKSLVQARSNSDERLIDDKALDLNDLLKSFEEHSLYQKQIQGNNQQQKQGQKQLTIAQVIAGEAIDEETALIQKTCQGADFEKL